MTKERSRLFGSVAQWASLASCAALGLALFFFVDLTPHVQGDFFFSKSDPQARKSASIEEEFAGGEQIFVAVRSREMASRAYLERLRSLTANLQAVKGVSSARSITHGPEEGKDLQRDPAEIFRDIEASPFWSRLLLAPDRSASFIVLEVRGKNQKATVAGIDRVLAKHSRAGFNLTASGVPYVTEHIRQELARDFQRFSIAAFIAFGVLVLILFRSAAILVGTMLASLSAAFATFLVRALAGMRTDVLAPNLWTIAFILTLSHVVYLAAQWRRQERELGRERAVRESLRLVGPGSCWSLVANLLGFASLIFVSAKPLRQFGISGAIAAVLALICAYAIFPPFLRSARANTKSGSKISGVLEKFFTARHRIIGFAAIAIAVAFAPFALIAKTDPSLPSYFAGGENIRTGLEAIDRSSGSSPLDLVVAAAGGGSLDNEESFQRLQALQHALERHRDVGAVLSIAPLMAETKRPWYSVFFSWKTRVDQLEKAKNARIGRTFLSEDRERARFVLRMHEQARQRPREEVINEIETAVRSHGFRPVTVGGLYPLQGELSHLVEGSVVKGLGGMLAGFFLIMLIVSRSFLTALGATLCLAITPFTLFGLVGLIGMPLDIISAPAANVALPMGIDEMIHLGYTARRMRQKGRDVWKAWSAALSELWAPILASMLIVTAGFSLFLLSSFPPTQRLGVLVCVGAAITDLVVLVVLPAIVTLGHRAVSSAARRKAG